MKKCMSLVLCMLVLLCFVSCSDQPVHVYRTAVNEYYKADSYRIVAEGRISCGAETETFNFKFRMQESDWSLTDMLSETSIVIDTKIKDVLFSSTSLSGVESKVRRTITETEEATMLRPYRAVMNIPELAADDMQDAKLVGYSNDRVFSATVDKARFDKYVENLLYEYGFTDVTDTVTVEEVTYTAKVDYDGSLTGLACEGTATVSRGDQTTVSATFEVDLFIETINSTHVSAPDDAAEYVQLP